MSPASPFHITKAHAYHSKSPSMQQISAMLNADNIYQVENILQQTSYAKILEEIRPSVSLADFEVAMRREYAEKLHLFQRSTPRDVQALLNAYSLIIEAENMDLILQSIIRGVASDTLEHNIIPVGKFGMRHYRRMYNTTTAEAASDLIIDFNMRKNVQKALNQTSDPDEQIFYVSSALSHTSFLQLNKIAHLWVRNEIEFLNLETVCRAIQLDIDPSPWMIPNKGIVNRHLSAIANLKSPRDVLNYMLNYMPVKGPLKNALSANDEDLIPILEDQVLSYIYAKRYKQFFLRGNSKEALLDFFAIKKAEIDDISRILFSKLNDVPSDIIRGMLFPIYKRS